MKEHNVKRVKTILKNCIWTVTWPITVYLYLHYYMAGTIDGKILLVAVISHTGLMSFEVSKFLLSVVKPHIYAGIINAEAYIRMGSLYQALAQTTNNRVMEGLKDACMSMQVEDGKIFVKGKELEDGKWQGMGDELEGYAAASYAIGQIVRGYLECLERMDYRKEDIFAKAQDEVNAWDVRVRPEMGEEYYNGRKQAFNDFTNLVWKYRNMPI